MGSVLQAYFYRQVWRYFVKFRVQMWTYQAIVAYSNIENKSLLKRFELNMDFVKRNDINSVNGKCNPL